MTWLAGKFGERAANWLVIAAVFGLLLVIGVTLSRCDSWRQRSAVEAQATQTTKSGAAIADAASVAVDMTAEISDHAAQLDAATAVALERIDHAQDPVAVRSAVADAMCVRDPSYCERPAR